MSHNGSEGKVNKTAEPATKRARAEPEESKGEEDEKIEKLLEQASTIQQEVETLIDEENKEVAKVQEQYAKKRVDVYERRNKLFKAIPHFWTDVILKSPVADYLNDDDVSIMEYLTEVKFIESSNPVITLCFDKNPFFSNKEITKRFRVVEDGLESQEFEIDWAEGHNIAEMSKAPSGGKGFGKRRHRNGKESFFLWFTNEAVFDENNMVDAIRDLYQYPTTFFNQEFEDEQGGFEGESGKIHGSNPEEEEDYFEDGEDEFDDGGDNGRTISPMLRGQYDDDGNDGEDND